jgi:photoactive yellow protein
MTVVREEVVVDSVERLAAMSVEDVDDLPYGFLILDGAGTVRLYNRYESRMSRLAPERVVGRNWFKDVAPCTRVDAFYGRFRRLVDDPRTAIDTFGFRFHFLHGAQDVTVQLTRAPDETATVFMTVVRKNLEGPAFAASRAVTLDEETGTILGPLGVAHAIPSSALGRLLGLAGDDQARAVGADVGRALAEAAERDAGAAGAASLDAAPPLLRSGVLDAALARAGLGRLALDQTALAGSGALGLWLTPPGGAGSRALVPFYEGVLGAALSASTGRPQLARCLEPPGAEALPWAFAAVPLERATLLASAGHAAAGVLARELGLSGFPDD